MIGQDLLRYGNVTYAGNANWESAVLAKIVERSRLVFQYVGTRGSNAYTFEVTMERELDGFILDSTGDFTTFLTEGAAAAAQQSVVDARLLSQRTRKFAQEVADALNANPDIKDTLFPNS